MGTAQQEQKDYAQTIHASAQTLLTLIEDILDISKIESGKVTLETTDFDLHGLVNSIAMMLAPQAHAKGLNFSVHIAPETPFLLRGDPLHVRQVLINLVGNAIKFTEHGEIEIRVKLLKEDLTSASIRYEVIDTGIGIPQEAQARIFESLLGGRVHHAVMANGPWDHHRQATCAINERSDRTDQHARRWLDILVRDQFRQASAGDANAGRSREIGGQPCAHDFIRHG
jgi:K+-sensing histidine kinase KdpD